MHAQERFWEMDFRRHVTGGRLAELFGPAQVKTDTFLRTMGWRRVAEQEWPLISAQSRQYLRAYAGGVNAWLRDHSGAAASLEYAVLGLSNGGYRIAPWDPVNSLAWLKAMAWDLRGNIEDETARATLVNAGTVHSGVFAELRGDGPLGGADLAGTGLNSWVVSGVLTTTGKPILANDPHLSPTMPGIWYQMGLHCTCELNVAGFTFSGVPGVVIGHNARIAWGFTNLDPDVTDLYLEKLDGDRYQVDGQWRPLEIRHETITVAGSAPVQVTVRSTNNGPLVSDASVDFAKLGAGLLGTGPLGTGPPGGGGSFGDGSAVALRWTALDPGRTMDALFALDRAGDWAGFRAAVALFEVPAQNITYADADGNIGYQAPGRIPVRGKGDGRWPAPGWDSAYDWKSFIPFAALPSSYNPAGGYLVTANQAVVDSSYPYLLTNDWAYGYRSRRIQDLVEQATAGGGKLSVDAVQQMPSTSCPPATAPTGRTGGGWCC